jgi:hypothetical protein
MIDAGYCLPRSASADAWEWLTSSSSCFNAL